MQAARVQYLVQKQQRLVNAVRVYNYVVGFHLRAQAPIKAAPTADVVVMCDTFYELHSELIRVEEELKQLTIEETERWTDFERDLERGQRMYDV